MKRSRSCDGLIDIEKQRRLLFKVENEKMTTTDKLNLCLRFESTTNNASRFYVIDPLFHTTSTTPPLVSATQLFEVSNHDLPVMFSTVFLDSKLFFIGGYEFPNGEGIPSSEILFIDTTHFPNAVLEEAPLMVSGKSFPIVVAVNGKIYALGNSFNLLDIKPWAEVFDIGSNSWSDLPFPPDHVICYKQCSANYVYHEKTNRIITTYESPNQPGDLWYFDITTNSWGYLSGMHNLCYEFNSIHGRAVVVDDDLYLMAGCRNSTLFVSSLVQPSSMIQVHGLEEATKSLNPVSDDLGVPSFLSHLGNGLLCLVWCVHELFNVAYVQCLKFHVNNIHTSEPYAVIERCDSYFVDGVGEVRDCLPIVLRNTTNQNVYHPQTTLPCANSSQRRTRHARRVLVDGLPPKTNAQTIERFFTDNIVLMLDPNGPCPLVLDIYINKEKNFAIVELSSEEQANSAMVLGDPRLNGHRLTIRRPGDYSHVEMNSMFGNYDSDDEDIDSECLRSEAIQYVANSPTIIL